METVVIASIEGSVDVASLRSLRHELARRTRFADVPGQPQANGPESLLAHVAHTCSFPAADLW